eukprot:scaffold84678_cov20-Tisochrysis_lutea.AAC.3
MEWKQRMLLDRIRAIRAAQATPMLPSQAEAGLPSKSADISNSGMGLFSGESERLLRALEMLEMQGGKGGKVLGPPDMAWAEGEDVGDGEGLDTGRQAQRGGKRKGSAKDKGGVDKRVGGKKSRVEEGKQRAPAGRGEKGREGGSNGPALDTRSGGEEGNDGQEGGGKNRVGLYQDDRDESEEDGVQGKGVEGLEGSGRSVKQQADGSLVIGRLRVGPGILGYGSA